MHGVCNDTGALTQHPKSYPLCSEGPPRKYFVDILCFNLHRSTYMVKVKVRSAACALGSSQQDRAAAIGGDVASV